jgi:single-strand DNA-binding protein
MNVRSLNRVTLVGRVGGNPEINHIPSIGRDVAKFSLATNEGYRDKNNEWKETTEWHNLVAWGPLAQRIEKIVSKGTLLLIEGKLKTRKWKDQNDQNRSRTEIEIVNLVVLEKSNRGAPYSGSDSYSSGPSDPQAPLPEKDINDAEYPYDESGDPF